MAFAEKMSRFSAPGPFGSMNLRAALESAREAAVASPPPPVEESGHGARSAFSQKATLSDAGVTENVRPAEDSEAKAVPGSVTTKSVSGPGTPPVRSALTYGAGPSGVLSGTEVDTEFGARAIETLKIGDRIQATDGMAEILWIAVCPIDEEEESHAPVRFARKVLGNTRPLTLAPTQRVRISGKSVSRLTGADEALIGAHALVDGRAIARVPADGGAYVVVLLDSHRLIEVAGTCVESFLPTRDRVAALPEAQRADFIARFPSWAEEPTRYGPSVRPILSALESVAQDKQ